MNILDIPNKIFHFFTDYVSYGMIIIGNVGLLMMFLAGARDQYMMEAIIWVTIFDLGTITIYWYYHRKPAISAK